ncbi:MAG: L,D-transpeptidase [Gemmatimonadetes bacterium]|nr:L,D-transpeptidase [Gemmatimonadota bacterium]
MSLGRRSTLLLARTGCVLLAAFMPRTADAQSLIAVGEEVFLDILGSTPGTEYALPGSDEYYLRVVVEENSIYLMRGKELVKRYPVATGSGSFLEYNMKHGGGWKFDTPVGVFTVGRKETNPVWYAPDWFYVEKGLRVPPPASPKRYFPGDMGSHAIYLGDGLAIHGTKNQASVGRAVSHGCMRMAKGDIDEVYKRVEVGTKVLIQ